MPQLIGIILAIFLVVEVVKFIKLYIAPAIGAIVVIVISLGIGYALYMFFKDPTKRAIKNASKKIEERRQKLILNMELRRKLSSEEEKAKAEAFILSTKLYEETIKSLGNEESNNSLEDFRIKAEENILKSKIDDIDAIIAKYKETIEKIENSTYLSSEEKANLYKNAI